MHVAHLSPLVSSSPQMEEQHRWSSEDRRRATSWIICLPNTSDGLSTAADACWTCYRLIKQAKLVLLLKRPSLSTTLNLKVLSLSIQTNHAYSDTGHDYVRIRFGYWSGYWPTWTLYLCVAAPHAWSTSGPTIAGVTSVTRIFLCFPTWRLKTQLSRDVMIQLTDDVMWFFFNHFSDKEVKF